MDVESEHKWPSLLDCHSETATSSSSTGCRAEDERKPLRRVRHSVSWRLWLVASIGFWERAAFWGLTAPWQNYMEHPPHRGNVQTPGALGLGQINATRIYCAFYLFYYTTPILFAVVADSYLGRYPTLLTSVALYCLGCTVLTTTSMTSSLGKGLGLPGLVLSMILIGVGGGAFRAVIVTFIADQHTNKQPETVKLKTGEHVRTDYQLTLQYIYNIYYWVGNVGSLSWFATVYIEKHVGFTAAYGLTLGFMVVAAVTTAVGGRWYVKAPHEGNPLPEAAKIIACACTSGFSMSHARPQYQLEHYQRTVSWSPELPDELARGLRACRVLFAFVMFYICFDQMQNNLISQAAQMEASGTPNDILPAMNQVGCILFGPLIQGSLYPFLHRRRIYLKPIMRITIGFGFVALSMLYAAVVQHRIYSAPPCYTHLERCGPNHVNVWVQAPLYFLMSAGEIFALVTALEYAYDHAPKRMKVVVQAFGLLAGSAGSAGALTLTAAARNPHLVTFYASLTAGMVAVTVAFWLAFHRYDDQASAGGRDASQSDTASRQEQMDSRRTRRRFADPAPTLDPIDAGRPLSFAVP